MYKQLKKGLFQSIYILLYPRRISRTQKIALFHALKKYVYLGVKTPVFRPPFWCFMANMQNQQKQQIFDLDPLAKSLLSLIITPLCIPLFIFDSLITWIHKNGCCRGYIIFTYIPITNKDIKSIVYLSNTNILVILTLYRCCFSYKQYSIT